MQKLQLYIDTTPLNASPTYQRVDLFKDESVSITQTIQNVRDIKKIFTEFTQTFTIPASKENNKIFIHYDNFDITNGYDGRKKRRAKIELNFIPFKTGFVKLEGVQLKKNKAYSYKITFFGETVNLKDLLGDDDLGSLSALDTLSLNYTQTNVRNKLTAAIGDIITPLISHTKQLYYDSNTHIKDDGNLYFASSGGGTQHHGLEYTDLKFALRINKIIEAIESEYTTANGFSSDLVFSNDFFKNTLNTRFYNLYMWLHRKKGSVEPAQQIQKEYAQIYVWSWCGTGIPTLGSSGGGIFISSQYVTYPNSIINHTLTLTPDTGYGSVVYDIQILRNSTVYAQRTGVTGTQTFTNSDFSLTAGTWTVKVGTTASALVFGYQDVEWEINGYLGTTGTGWQDKWCNGFALTTGADFPFTITQQIPKMKIIDFLTGVFQMFNLTAYVENGVIVVQTLDNFYAASTTTWDINEYVDVDSSTIDLALPFREIEFSYGGTGTFLAQQFEQLNNIGWGATDFSLDNAIFDAPEGNYKITIPFEHMQYQRLVDANGGSDTTIQWGWSVNENQEAYYGKPLLFYPIRQTSGTGISFITSTTSNVQLTTYIIPSNSVALNPSTDKSNIHFTEEVNEYTEDTGFDATLFKSYYETYITDVYNNKRRLTKVKAFLPLKMIYNLKLNDKISLNNNTYIINSVKTDLTTGKSDLELLNVV